MTARRAEPPVAALATPEGASEMALVRVSGEGCARIVERMFAWDESGTGSGSGTLRTGTGSGGTPPVPVPSHPTPRAEFGSVCGPGPGSGSGSGSLPDLVHRGRLFLSPHGPAIPAIVIRSLGSRSYTGEESLEILLPGAPALVRGVLARLAELGIAAAAPGEFTRRAFLHGRIDLTRAESVAAIIAAEDLAEARAARRTLDGELAEAVRAIGDELHDEIASLEAGLDFADQEVAPPPAAALAAHLERLEARLAAWAGRPDPGSAPGAALRFLLWGRTNAGKSTLLNALAGEERAIVSPRAGTTTDAVGVTLDTAAGTVDLLDLPGRLDELSPRQARAEELARRELAEGDRILYVFDAAREPEELRREWESLPGAMRERAWPVLNQVDRLSPSARRALPGWPERALCSGLRGEGVPELRARIAAARRSGDYDSRGLARLFNDRQRRGLEECRERLAVARGEIAAAGRVEPELAVVDLRRAHAALEEITGELATEETLDRIFARFCVGK